MRQAVLFALLYCSVLASGQTVVPEDFNGVSNEAQAQHILMNMMYEYGVFKEPGYTLRYTIPDPEDFEKANGIQLHEGLVPYYSAYQRKHNGFADKAKQEVYKQPTEEEWEELRVRGYTSEPALRCAGKEKVRTCVARVKGDRRSVDEETIGMINCLKALASEVAKKDPDCAKGMKAWVAQFEEVWFRYSPKPPAARVARPNRRGQH